MKFRIRAVVATIIATGLSAAPATASEQPPAIAHRPRKTADAPIAELVRELSDSRYAVRHRATVELGKRGGAAIPVLTVVARSSKPEAAARAVLILESIYTNLTVDSATVAQAEIALEALQKSNRPSIAQLAGQVFTRHDDLREKRAVAAIERLGGIVKYESDRYRAAPFATERAQINFVVLGSKWKGGDDGLKYISRLPNMMALYVARNKKFTPISLKGQARLQRELPNLKIEERGLACLGVRGSRGGFNNIGCYIQDVEPKSAAARGGLQTGDIVSHFAGKKVNDFEKLVELIGEYSPGETIEVSILRNGRPKALKVTLGEWTK